MKTLVVYATRYGSVTNALDILVPELRDEVTVVRLGHDEVPEADAFDTVIIGGSIYIGKIQKEVTRFCRDNTGVLLGKRLGLFVCAGEEDGEKRNRTIGKVFPPELLEHASAVSWFGHEVHWEKATGMDRFALKMARGAKGSHSDLRRENIADFAAAMNG